jgi:hypothetical protein
VAERMLVLEASISECVLNVRVTKKVSCAAGGAAHGQNRGSLLGVRLAQLFPAPRKRRAAVH